MSHFQCFVSGSFFVIAIAHLYNGNLLEAFLVACLATFLVIYAEKRKKEKVLTASIEAHGTLQAAIDAYETSDAIKAVFYFESGSEINIDKPLAVDKPISFVGADMKNSEKVEISLESKRYLLS